MIRVFLLLVVFISGCEEQADSPQQSLKDSNTSTVPKHKHPAHPNDPPICENLSVIECLTIIIPAIWDQEVERDCS